MPKSTARSMRGPMNEESTSYRGIFGLIARRPRLIITAALVLSVVSAGYTWKRMEFLTGRDQLMPANTSFNRDYQAYRAEFGDQEEIAVVIESSDSSLAGRFGERLAARLTADRQHFRDVFF